MIILENGGVGVKEQRSAVENYLGPMDFSLCLIISFTADKRL
jgi:hypothetical protein